MDSAPTSPTTSRPNLKDAISRNIRRRRRISCSAAQYAHAHLARSAHALNKATKLTPLRRDQSRSTRRTTQVAAGQLGGTPSVPGRAARRLAIIGAGRACRPPEAVRQSRHCAQRTPTARSSVVKDVARVELGRRKLRHAQPQSTGRPATGLADEARHRRERAGNGEQPSTSKLAQGCRQPSSRRG